MKKQQYRVDKIIRESSTILSFFLKPKDGEPLADFKPGQFITIYVQPDGFEKPVSRSYTLSDRPGKDYYRITVKKELDGVVSNFLHEQIVPGDWIEGTQPAGNFYLDEGTSAPIVLLSGGVGIMPMMSMLEQLVFTHPERKVYFLHSSTNKEVLPMAERLTEIKDRHTHVLVNINHSRPTPGEHQVIDYDVEGVITKDQLKATIVNPATCIYYLCGPGSFMQTMYNYLIELGVPTAAIHYEFFGNAIQLEAPKLSQPMEPTFEVKFERTGKTTRWTGEYSSLLELAESMEIPVLSSCRMGTCLSCESRLITGEVKYDPEPLMETEEGQVLICCSQPTSDLVVDL